MFGIERLLQNVEQIAPVVVVDRLAQPLQLRCVNEPFAEGDLLDAGDFESLPRFDPIPGTVARNAPKQS